jgi:hypothetical protein
MPTFSTVPGPPHSGIKADGRTLTSPSPCANNPDKVPRSTGLPVAIDCTDSAGIAKLRGTGNCILTSRCRHFARQPWQARSTPAEGVISVTSGRFRGSMSRER